LIIGAVVDIGMKIPESMHDFFTRRKIIQWRTASKTGKHIPSRDEREVGGTHIQAQKFA
jgi:hypothetical protein